MIKSFELNDFKSHTDSKIELGQLTALAGPNGSGKTALLDALDWAVRRLQNDYSSRPSNENKDQDRVWSYRLAVASGHGVGVESGKSSDLPDRRILIDTDLSSPGLTVRYLRLDAGQLGLPAYFDGTKVRISADGYGLASYWADMMTSDPESVGSILEQIKAVLPFVHGFRARRAKIETEQLRTIAIDGKTISYPDKREVIGHELLVDVDGAEQLPASQLSEGTLLVIGLLTVICGPDRPRLLLLDDVDRGLHPGAQRQLMRLLRKILERNPDLQIVLTTHSPYVIDEMAAEEVWILATDSAGVTHSRRLSDHPDAAEALEMLSTGEFLDAEGEAWVLEDRDVTV